MSDKVIELPRALTAVQRKLVEDPELQQMVAEMAAHYGHRVKKRIEERDFFQAGMEGASRAARRFDPSAGASFKTYAWSDIRGAMCALIKAATRAARIVDRGAASYLEEVSDDAGPNDTPEQHQARLEDFSNGYVDHMFAAVASEGSKTVAAGAEEMTAERDTIGLVRAGMAALSDPQRSLIDLVYFEKGILKKAVGRPGFPNYIKVRRVYGEAVSVLRVFLAERGVTTAV